MRRLVKLADYRLPGSPANVVRRRRAAMLERLARRIPTRLRVLDVGGTAEFWAHDNLADRLDAEVVVLNLFNQEPLIPRVTTVIGDAASMPQFTSQEFELVVSNSVIEHLGTLDRQMAMANEVARIGKRYFIQTPNRNFPLEPHFLIPGFQWMPVAMRVALLQRFSLGWFERTADPAAAEALIREIRLLSGGELRRMFPGSRLWCERVAGLTKSYVVLRGWETSQRTEQPGSGDRMPGARRKSP